jgi:flagellar biosynthesis protein FliQ
VTDSSIIDIAIQTMIIVAKLSAPVLVVSLGIGVGVSLVQAMTQVQEVTLTFVPKLVGVGLVIAVGGNWMLAELIGFTHHLFDQIPQLLAGA